MDKQKYFEEVTKELLITLSSDNTQIEETLIQDLIDCYRTRRRVFTHGQGRAGLMSKCLAMRLRHLGIDSYNVGETVTPPVDREDLVIIGSGSGITETVAILGLRAKEQYGAKLALVTWSEKTPLAKAADYPIILRAPDKTTKALSLPSVQYMGNRFEQSMLIYYDYLVMRVAEALGITGDLMQTRHTNME